MQHIHHLILFLINSVKYFKFKKLMNLLMVYFSYLTSNKKLKFSKVLRPVFMSVEPADFCQLKCPECPVGQKAKNKGEIIQNDLFYKVIDELKNELFHVIFYFQGEPLLNRNLHEMISYAHKANIFTSTSTNAQLLNSQRAEELVLAGLDKLIISIDGSTQEVYEKYRQGGSLEKAIQGVKFIVEWKKKLKSITPFVEIQFVVFKTNEHQLKEMKALAKCLKADRLVFKSAQLYNFENGNILLTSLDKYARYKQLYDGKYIIKNSLPNRCSRLWNGAVINTKGELLPCCFDKDASYAFGNLEDNSFIDVWHNSKASGFRTSIITNRKQHEMCRNCTSK